jgi:hypothetical protein
MLAASPRVVSYRLHKPTNQAVVTFNGKDVYLGQHGTAESRERYDRAIAEWLANGRRLHVAFGPARGPADRMKLGESTRHGFGQSLGDSQLPGR